jgi:hypothetical protein
MTNFDEARLNGARVRLSAAKDSLATYSLTKLGFAPRSTEVHVIPKSDDDKVAEKQEKEDKKMLKRKLPAPKDGWLDKKRHRLAYLSR